MAQHDAEFADPEGFRGPHVVHFAEFEGLRPQQAAEAGPAGDAEDDAEKQEAQIGALFKAGKVGLVAADIGLQQQDGGRDQQHAGDGVQRGIEVLNGVIDPAAKVAGHQPHDDRERQHHQGGERADHEARADAFQGLVQHILADLVGAEDMIMRRELTEHGHDHGHERKRQQHGIPGRLKLVFATAGQRRPV